MQRAWSLPRRSHPAAPLKPPRARCNPRRKAPYIQIPFLIDGPYTSCHLWPRLRRLHLGRRRGGIHRVERGNSEVTRPVRGSLKQTVIASLPRPLAARLTRWRRRTSLIPLGWARLGILHRLNPISRRFGADRGRPIDRYYIERFLEVNAPHISGRVLEIGDAAYTRQFGGDRVLRSDVLHVEEGNPEATFVGDLASADHIPSDAFDCVILTQTLQFIYDVPAGIATIHRILKPGGVLLSTFPGITHTGDPHWCSTWCWSFTTVSAERLFREKFDERHVAIESFGNVLVAAAFLYGLADRELSRRELDYHDPFYPVVITVRAVKCRTGDA